MQQEVKTMRRTANIELDSRKIPLATRVSDREKVSAILGRAQSVMSHYTTLFNTPGLGRFHRRFETEIGRLEPGDDEYMLISLNFLLWLYELGNRDDAAESIRLFSELAAKTLAIRRLPVTKKKISVQDTPISPRAQRLITGYRTEMLNGRNRTFNTLQALISGLAFAAYGRQAYTPQTLVHQALSSGIPAVSMGLCAAAGAKTPEYTLVYSRVNSAFNTSLLAAVQAKPLCLLLRYLMLRAAPVGQRTTRVLTREELAARLLTYIATSRNLSISEVLDASLIFSNDYVW